jgi:putative membrane protein
MKKLSSMMLLALAALAFQSCGGGASNDSKANADSANYTKDTSTNATTTGGIAVVNDDAEFAVAAANGGMAEVELSKLAETKATNAKVKEFAAMMTKDHGGANTELMALAKTKNITLPTTIGEDKQKTMGDLQTKTGAEFDKAYVDVMVKDHKATVDLFEKASTDAKDADIKSFAIKTLPVLKNHLQAIETIQKGM